MKIPTQNIYIQKDSEFGKVPFPDNYKNYLKHIGSSLYEGVVIKYKTAIDKECGILIRARYPYNSNFANHSQTIEVHPYPFEECYIDSFKIKKNIGSELVKNITRGRSSTKILFKSNNKMFINHGEK